MSPAGVGWHRSDVPEKRPAKRAATTPAETARHCARCMFRGEKGMNLCDYIIITGKPRGCPLGLGCTAGCQGRG